MGQPCSSPFSAARPATGQEFAGDRPRPADSDAVAASTFVLLATSVGTGEESVSQQAPTMRADGAQLKALAADDKEEAPADTPRPLDSSTPSSPNSSRLAIRLSVWPVGGRHAVVAFLRDGEGAADLVRALRRIRTELHKVLRCTDIGAAPDTP